jgi:hypothetical protein
MSHFLLRSLAVLACLGLFSFAQAAPEAQPHHPHKPNFNGTWKLDHKASDSLEPLMKRIGASFLERKYAATATLKATFHQTEHVLKVATRGPGFALDESLYLDGRSISSNQELLGATSLKGRTAWSKDYQQLVENREIKTKHAKHGHLIIQRNLINEGKTLVVTFILKLNGEAHATSVRQLWHKQSSS